MKDPNRLGYDSQAIIMEVHFTPVEAAKYKVNRRTAFADERQYVRTKSSAWNKASHSHFTNHADNTGCAWCLGFLHFQNRYPIENALLSQEQDTGSESMKK